MKTRQCLKCNCIISVRSFLKHILNKHNLSEKEYYDLYLKQPDEGLCKNCGKQTRFYSITRGYCSTCSLNCGASLGQKKRYEKPEEHLKSSIITKKQMANSQARIILSKKAKERFSDPAERERISNAVKNSEIFKNKIHSEEYSINMHNLLIERYLHPENRLKMSESCKNSPKFKNGARQTKEFRERHSEIMHERLKNGKLMVKYEYNNETFMSLPEFAFYIWLKQHKVEFEYQCEPLFYEKNGVIKRYIPDFKVKGRYVEIKSPFLIKDNHLWDPFEKRFNIEKEQCMIKNNVYVMTEDKYNIFVNWFKKHYDNEFILNHRK